MESKFYKYCAVLQCKSTTIKTPDKLFIHVPRTENIRKKWLQLARRDPALMAIQSKMYFCEDHFDLPNDMENYTEYHVMGSISQIRIKAGHYPTKFECQPDRKSNTDTDMKATGSLPAKRQRLETILEYERELEHAQSTQSIPSAEVQPGPSSDIPQPAHVPITTDKSIQVYIYNKRRSKSTQTHIKFRNIAISPRKNVTTSISTSPFKLEVASTSGHTKSSRKLCFNKQDRSDSDGSLFTPSLGGTNSSSMIMSSEQMDPSSGTTSSLKYEEAKKLQAEQIVKIITDRIKKRPKFYIGVPEKCCYLINTIRNNTNIPENHILLCLKKIRLDTKFSELADDFGISLSYASKIFLKNVPIISSVMQPFFVNLEKNALILSLPMAFRHKYHHVSCIIDCLEIEIQKPSNSVHQALTWSDYKKANTLKYLISSTPDGLVNFISTGYGGRTSDVCVVENSNFLNTLEKGSCILADRGFKHIEQMVLKAGHQLVRPPSVSSGSKLSKQEARQTNEIASLRIHIERVIRRLREFAMLKPHACVNNNLTRVLDEVIVIACALINLQDSIIK